MAGTEVLMQDKEVRIVLRHSSTGSRGELFFVCWDLAAGYADLMMKDPSVGDDEILLVLLGDTCIYSALSSSSVCTWKDILGFFV